MSEEEIIDKLIELYDVNISKKTDWKYLIDKADKYELKSKEKSSILYYWLSSVYLIAIDINMDKIERSVIVEYLEKSISCLEKAYAKLKFTGFEKIGDQDISIEIVAGNLASILFFFNDTGYLYNIEKAVFYAEIYSNISEYYSDILLSLLKQYYKQKNSNRFISLIGIIKEKITASKNKNKNGISYDNIKNYLDNIFNEMDDDQKGIINDLLSII